MTKIDFFPLPNHHHVKMQEIADEISLIVGTNGTVTIKDGGIHIQYGGSNTCWIRLYQDTKYPSRYVLLDSHGLFGNATSHELWYLYNMIRRIFPSESKK
jgi:hypothetical protein